MAGPGGLPSMGSHRVGHDWSDLAAAATHFKCGRKKFAESDIIRKYLVFCLVHGISETCNVIQIFFRVRIFVFSVLCLVAQSCPTLWDPMNYSLPGSYVHGVLQARILEWISLSSSRSSQPKDWTQVSFITGDFLYPETPEKVKNTGVGSLSLLQGNLPDAGIEPALAGRFFTSSATWEAYHLHVEYKKIQQTSE